MISACSCVCFFFFQAEDGIRDLTVTGVQTCALPISGRRGARRQDREEQPPPTSPTSPNLPQPCRSHLNTIHSTPIVAASTTESTMRSEEHTSELQSQSNLVCRLLLEKKKKIKEKK